MLLKLRIFLVVIFTCFSSVVHGYLNGYITSADKIHFQKIAEKSLITAESDYSTVYYGVKPCHQLGVDISDALKTEICLKIDKSYKPNDENIEVIFRAIHTWKLLKCVQKLNTAETVKYIKTTFLSTQQTLRNSTIAELRYSVEILQMLEPNVPIPNVSQIATVVDTKINSNSGDQLQNVANAFHLAAAIGVEDAGKFATNHIESTMEKALEVDKKMLYWEGGLTVTSMLTTGLLRVAKPTLFKRTDFDKLSQYFLSRRTVQTGRGVLALLEGATALANHVQASVAVVATAHGVVSQKSDVLRIELCNLLGESVVLRTVVAQSTTRVSDDVVVLSKQAFKRSEENPIIYEMPFRLDSGLYKIVISAGETANDEAGNVILTARVVSPIEIVWLEVGVHDVDHTGPTKLTRLQKFGDQLTTDLQADSNQRLIVKFELSRRIHQTFVRLNSVEHADFEVIFIAEPENSGNVYKADVKLVNQLSFSGDFYIELILGDSSMPLAVRWLLGKLHARQIGGQQQYEPPPYVAQRQPKPVIQHIFRSADKRPAEFVSLVFTGLTLSPLLVLLIGWYTIGINFRNFSVHSVAFFTSLALVLMLYVAFWYQLNMFQTCGFLVVFGTCTFLTGHRMLYNMAKYKMLQ